MSAEEPTVRLKSLMCFVKDEDKFDNIYIKYKKEKIWPSGKKHAAVSVSSAELNVDAFGITAKEGLTLETWDYDQLSPNNPLGKTKIIRNQASDPYTIDITSASDKEVARYSIE